MSHPVVEEVAALAAKHKLVPFLGAGCSMPHLMVDWNGITARMGAELGIEVSDNIQAAQSYVERFGRDGLCELLKDSLLVEEFDDVKGTTHLQILSLQVGSIYTTNQDNVMERCVAKYGRKHKTVITLEDYGSADPGQPLYIKYHGDLEVPESVVFTTEDFERRMTTKHFLNIKLEADLLTKSLFFVGYSFRDPNIQKTFQELRMLFGELPPSYMLAYRGSPELAALCEEYGIKLIVPMEVHPDASTVAEAFTRTLSDIVGATAHLKREDELESFFRPAVPPTLEVVTRYELDAIKSQAGAESAGAAIARVRGYLDMRVIPKDFQSEVADLFIDLARRCQTAEDGDELNAAAFNLLLTEPDARLKVLAALYATANVRESEKPFDIFLPRLHHGTPAEWTLPAIMLALKLLEDWGRRVTDGLRSRISTYIENDGVDPSSYSPEILATARHYLDRAWTDRTWGDHTVFEHPLKRYERLRALPFTNIGKAKAPDRLADEMMGLLPHGFLKPYDA